MSDKEVIKGPAEDVLCMFFTQNLDQVNNSRSIIMWFTDVYILVIVGTVALLGSADFKNQLFLPLFFTLVTVLGLAITIRMDSRIKERLKKGEAVMRELNIYKYKVDSTGIITWRESLIAFYIVMLLVWLYLLILLLID